MIEIKKEDVKKMRVWNDKKANAVERYVVFKHKNYFYCVSVYFRREFENGECFDLFGYKHAEPLEAEE